MDPILVPNVHPPGVLSSSQLEGWVHGHFCASMYGKEDRQNQGKCTFLSVKDAPKLYISLPPMSHLALTGSHSFIKLQQRTCNMVYSWVAQIPSFGFVCLFSLIFEIFQTDYSISNIIPHSTSLLSPILCSFSRFSCVMG